MKSRSGNRSGSPRSKGKAGRRKDKPAPEHDVLWGIHPVLEALRKRPETIKQITVGSGKSARLQEIIDLARERDISLLYESLPLDGADGQEMKHQGVMALIKPRPTISLDTLLAGIKAKSSPVLLALDTIQDPHNLGAIIRSALAAGVAGILVTRDRTAPLGGTVHKASAGAVSHMDICVVTNMVSALQRLQKEGVWLYGAVKEADTSLYETDFSGGPVCVVIGSEGKGLRPLVKEQCDFLVSIPMLGTLDSLNCSVAAAVILFEIARQRTGL